MEEGLLPELGRSTRKEAAVARVCERGEGLGEAVRVGPSRNVVVIVLLRSSFVPAPSLVRQQDATDIVNSIQEACFGHHSIAKLHNDIILCVYEGNFAMSGYSTRRLVYTVAVKITFRIGSVRLAGNRTIRGQFYVVLLSVCEQ